MRSISTLGTFCQVSTCLTNSVELNTPKELKATPDIKQKLAKAKKSTLNKQYMDAQSRIQPSSVLEENLATDNPII